MQLPIHIRDRGRALLLDYELFLDYHDGGALAGAAIGWRAMERAAQLLSEEQIWDRRALSVGARHAGPGVRDALEYVTRCFTRERFHAASEHGGAGPCGSAADFQFTVSDGRRVASLQLREGIVPAGFFAAVRACRAAPESEDARYQLSEHKRQVASIIAGCELRDLFIVELTPLMRLPEVRRA